MKKITISKILSNIFVSFLLISPMFIFAAPIGTPGSDSLNPLGTTVTLAEFIANILKVVIEIAIPVTALAIVYVGFLFVTAQGNTGQIDKAKEALKYTLIGLAVLLGAQAIVIIINDTVKSLGAK